MLSPLGNVGIIILQNLTIYKFFPHFRPMTISLHGTEYRVGAVVYVGSSDELPDFASIQGIFIFGADKIYFVLKRFITTIFSGHFHSYEVRRPAFSNDFVLEPKELKMYLPMHTVKASTCQNGVLYVTPRYLPPQAM